MNILGIVIGILLGSCAAFVNYLITKKGLLKDDVKSVSATNTIHMIVDLVMLAAIYFLRNVLPFNFMYAIIPAAVFASSGTLLFTYLLVKRLDAGQKAAKAGNNDTEG